MKHVQERLDQSERRVCRVLDQPRSTQRYKGVSREDDERLARRLHELARQHPRRGYRLMWGMLRREGWAGVKGAADVNGARVNIKRVHRVWRREHLRVPVKPTKRRRLGHSQNGILRQRSQHKDHVWAIDFIHDTDERDRSLKWLPTAPCTVPVF